MGGRNNIEWRFFWRVYPSDWVGRTTDVAQISTACPPPTLQTSLPTAVTKYPVDIVLNMSYNGEPPSTTTRSSTSDDP